MKGDTMDYKALEELNLKVGDTVVYMGVKEYKVGPNQTLIFPDGSSLKYQGWDVHRCFTLKEKDMKTGRISEIGAKVGDIVECVSWVGDYYKEGNFYPVVNGVGKRQVSIGTEDTTGHWKMAIKKELPYGHVLLPDGSIVDLTNVTVPLGLLDEVYGKGTQDAMNCHGGPYQYFNNGWRDISRIYDGTSSAYRVKPQPKIETVTLDSADIRFKGFLKGATITFNLIDGVPDCNSIKMEKLSD